MRRIVYLIFLDCFRHRWTRLDWRLSRWPIIKSSSSFVTIFGKDHDHRNYMGGVIVSKAIKKLQPDSSFQISWIFISVKAEDKKLSSNWRSTTLQGKDVTKLATDSL